MTAVQSLLHRATGRVQSPFLGVEGGVRDASSPCAPPLSTPSVDGFTAGDVASPPTAQGAATPTRLLALAMLGVTVVGSLGGCVAQSATATFSQSVSAADQKALREGLDAYVRDHAGADPSEAAVDEASAAYADIRSAANERELSALPAPVAQAFRHASGTTRAWIDQRLEVAGDHAGGGTMYGHAEPREHARLADVEASAISHARDRVLVAPALTAEPFSTRAGAPYHGDSPHYRHALEVEGQRLQDAKDAIRNLPPGAGRVMGSYLDQAARTWSSEPAQ
ncbi:MAG: hypothetical protein EB084_22620 [Proteobacteria bacterium]|nr:hypothetical protein [Pseudomonadota bacterium]